MTPLRYLKLHVKNQKNDATGAEAIYEAVKGSNMRFVPTKTHEQQSIPMLHRTRHLLVHQRTSTINAIRFHLDEYGTVSDEGAPSPETV